VAHAPPVFAALDGRTDFARDLRVTVVIVRQRRLFDPRQVFVLDPAEAVDRIHRRERLVVVHHHRDVLPSSTANGANHFDVFLRGGITDLGLHAGETAAGPI